MFYFVCVLDNCLITREDIFITAFVKVIFTVFSSFVLSVLFMLFVSYIAPLCFPVAAMWLLCADSWHSQVAIVVIYWRQGVPLSKIWKSVEEVLLLDIFNITHRSASSLPLLGGSSENGLHCDGLWQHIIISTVMKSCELRIAPFPLVLHQHDVLSSWVGGCSGRAEVGLPF